MGEQYRRRDKTDQKNIQLIIRNIINNPARSKMSPQYYGCYYLHDKQETINTFWVNHDDFFWLLKTANLWPTSTG